MIGLDLVVDLGIILAAAALLLLGARAARVPSIVAYIVAGVVLGPATGLVRTAGTLELISEVGIALLLFLVGLEMSLDKIRSVGKAAVVAGVGQVAVSAVLGGLLGIALGFEPVAAALIGLALAISSTVVVVKLLERSDELATVHGSKGREWETVVIVGFEADRMPNRRSLADADDPARLLPHRLVPCLDPHRGWLPGGDGFDPAIDIFLGAPARQAQTHGFALPVEPEHQVGQPAESGNGHRIGIDLVELGEIPFKFQILRTALGPQTLGAFGCVPLPNCGDVDVGWRIRRPARVERRHCSSCGSPVPMYLDSW